MALYPKHIFIMYFEFKMAKISVVSKIGHIFVILLQMSVPFLAFEMIEFQMMHMTPILEHATKNINLNLKFDYLKLAYNFPSDFNRQQYNSNLFSKLLIILYKCMSIYYTMSI